MAITKGSGTSVIGSTASTTTSSAQDSSGAYATEAYISLVQVGTASTAAQVQIQVSPDASTFYSPPSLLWVAPLVAGTYNTLVAIPVTAKQWKAVFTQCTGGTSSTVVIQSNAVTGV